MTQEEMDNCWKDPRNRKWGFYHCPADPRIIVPKRWKWMGWTINAARPGAVPVATTNSFMRGFESAIEGMVTTAFSSMMAR